MFQKQSHTPDPAGPVRRGRGGGGGPGTEEPGPRPQVTKGICRAALSSAMPMTNLLQLGLQPLLSPLAWQQCISMLWGRSLSMPVSQGEDRADQERIQEEEQEQECLEEEEQEQEWDAEE